MFQSYAVALVLVLLPFCGADDDFFVYLNEYNEEGGNNNACHINEKYQHLTISRIPEGCHKLTPNPFRLTEEVWTLLVTKDNSSDTPVIDFLGLYCDANNCHSCTKEHAMPKYEECIEESAWGSFVLYPKTKFCKGGPELELRPGKAISISYFEQAQCSMTMPDDSDNVQHIRNYGQLEEGGKPIGCTQEKASGAWYDLNITETEKGRSFNGVVRCTDSQCSEGCTPVTQVLEGQEYRPRTGPLKDKCMMLWLTDDLLDPCEEVTEPPPGGRTTANSGASSDDPELVAALVGGGAALAFIVFGVAFIFRRKSSYPSPGGMAVSYHHPGKENKRNYGALDEDEEGMTTDI